jgi:hypothetical protein
MNPHKALSTQEALNISHCFVIILEVSDIRDIESIHFQLLEKQFLNYVWFVDCFKNFSWVLVLESFQRDPHSGIVHCFRV